MTFCRCAGSFSDVACYRLGCVLCSVLRYQLRWEYHLHRVPPVRAPEEAAVVLRRPSKGPGTCLGHSDLPGEDCDFVFGLLYLELEQLGHRVVACYHLGCVLCSVLRYQLRWEYHLHRVPLVRVPEEAAVVLRHPSKGPGICLGHSDLPGEDCDFVSESGHYRLSRGAGGCWTGAAGCCCCCCCCCWRKLMRPLMA